MNINETLDSCVKDIFDKLMDIEIRESFTMAYNISSTMSISIMVCFNDNGAIKYVDIALERFPDYLFKIHINYAPYSNIYESSITYKSSFYKMNLNNQESIVKLFIKSLPVFTNKLLREKSYMYIRDQKLNSLIYGD